MLRPYQADLIEKARQAYRNGYKSPCIVLPCGGGKSVIVAEMAKSATAKGNRVLFLVHRRELVEQIKRTFEWWGVNMDLCDVAMVQTVCRHITKIIPPKLIITDECFPAGTKIDGKAIETLKIGDYVTSYNEEKQIVEKKKVLSIMKHKAPDTLVVINNHLICTENHPIFEMNERRYINAGNLKQGQTLLYCMLQTAEMGTTYKRSEKCILQFRQKSCLLFRQMFQRILSSAIFGNNGEYKQKICICKNESEQSDKTSGRERKNISCKERKTVPHPAWRKWAWHDCSAENINAGIGGLKSVFRILRKNGWNCAVSSCLQSGYCNSEQNACNRSGRKKSSFGKSKRGRQKESDSIRTERVETVKIYKRADFDKLPRMCSTDFVYNLEVEDNHNYFAEGILVHNCHHSKATTYRQIYEAFPNAKRIGVTATPVRLDGSGLGDVNDRLVIGVSAKWLIEHKFLAPYDYYAPEIADLSGIKISHGEFETGSMEQILMKSAIYGDVVNHYKRLADGKKAVCYCVSVAHSKAVAEAFRSAGIKAMHIDGNFQHKERDRIISDFRRGEIKILCNVDLISEGFDVPDCECAILLRPTKSLTLYIQQSMRCMRYKDNKRAVIIDHVGNYVRFGMPDADREWSLQGRKKSEKNRAENDVKILQCPECFYTFVPPKNEDRICPHCYYLFPKKSRNIEENQGTELKKITGFSLDFTTPDDCKNMRDLQEYAGRHGYKKGWIYYQAKERGWL